MNYGDSCFNTTLSTQRKIFTRVSHFLAQSDNMYLSSSKTKWYHITQVLMDANTMTIHVYIDFNTIATWILVSLFSHAMNIQRIRRQTVHFHLNVNKNNPCIILNAIKLLPRVTHTFGTLPCDDTLLPELPKHTTVYTSLDQRSINWFQRAIFWLAFAFTSTKTSKIPPVRITQTVQKINNQNINAPCNIVYFVIQFGEISDFKFSTVTHTWWLHKDSTQDTQVTLGILPSPLPSPPPPDSAGASLEGRPLCALLYPLLSQDTNKPAHFHVSPLLVGGRQCLAHVCIF